MSDRLRGCGPYLPMPRPFLPPRGSKNNKRVLGGYAAPAAVGAIAAWAWLTKSSSAKPQLWVGEGDLKARVLPHCSVLLQPYTPSPLALNVHIQNVLGFVRGATIHGGYTRQLVMAHDGGTLGLDWFQACDAQRFGPADKPVLLVLHGINGGSHEGYCKWVCHEACKRGWRAVVLNYRGCAGLPLTSPRGYAATLTHDVHYAITSIKARFPTAPVFAVGYSLGGVFLTKYLSESDSGLHSSLAASTSSFTPFEGSGLVAAAVVSSPICLFNSSANLEVPWTPHYLYNMALAYKLREFMHEHRAAIRTNANLDLEKAMAKWTVGAMEDVGIPNTFGFANRSEYYEAVSSLKYIPHIATPTLFLMSQDDPFLGVLPDQECAANPNTLLAATEKGGHIAFLTGLWPLGPSYMEPAVLQFLETAWQNLPERAAMCTRQTVAPQGPTASQGPQAVAALTEGAHEPLQDLKFWQQLRASNFWQPRNAGVGHPWLNADVLPQESREPRAPVDWGQGAGPHPAGHLRTAGPPAPAQQLLLLHPPPSSAPSQAGRTAAAQEEAQSGLPQDAAAAEGPADRPLQGDGQAVQQGAQQTWASNAADLVLQPPNPSAGATPGTSSEPVAYDSQSYGGLQATVQPVQAVDQHVPPQPLQLGLQEQQHQHQHQLGSAQPASGDALQAEVVLGMGGEEEGLQGGEEEGLQLATKAEGSACAERGGGVEDEVHLGRENARAGGGPGRRVSPGRGSGLAATVDRQAMVARSRL